MKLLKAPQTHKSPMQLPHSSQNKNYSRRRRHHRCHRHRRHRRYCTGCSHIKKKKKPSYVPNKEKRSAKKVRSIAAGVIKSFKNQAVPLIKKGKEKAHDHLTKYINQKVLEGDLEVRLQGLSFIYKWRPPSYSAPRERRQEHQHKS
jgi:hypothetical protein